MLALWRLCSTYNHLWKFLHWNLPLISNTLHNQIFEIAAFVKSQEVLSKSKTIRFQIWNLCGLVFAYSLRTSFKRLLTKSKMTQKIIWKITNFNEDDPFPHFHFHLLLLLFLISHNPSTHFHIKPTGKDFLLCHHFNFPKFNCQFFSPYSLFYFLKLLSTSQMFQFCDDYKKRQSNYSNRWQPIHTKTIKMKAEWHESNVWMCNRLRGWCSPSSGNVLF